MTQPRTAGRHGSSDTADAASGERLFSRLAGSIPCRRGRVFGPPRSDDGPLCSIPFGVVFHGGCSARSGGGILTTSYIPPALLARALVSELIMLRLCGQKVGPIPRKTGLASISRHVAATCRQGQAAPPKWREGGSGLQPPHKHVDFALGADER